MKRAQIRTLDATNNTTGSNNTFNAISYVGGGGITIYSFVK